MNKYQVAHREELWAIGASAPYQHESRVMWHGDDRPEHLDLEVMEFDLPSPSSIACIGAQVFERRSSRLEVEQLLVPLGRFSIYRTVERIPLPLDAAAVESA